MTETQRHRVESTATAVAALSVGVALAALFALTQAHRMYFFGDDWSFLLERNLNVSGLLEPHNEHWSTLPVIAFRVMVRIFGIDHYLFYGAMPILLHVAACVLLYRLMRRHRIDAWPAVIATLMLAFLVGGLAENPLWDFQIGFLGSAVLGLLCLLVVAPVADQDDRLTPRASLPRGRLITVWGLTVLSLMCSGMAVFMLGWLAIHLWISRGLRSAVNVSITPALVYLAWYAVYGRDATAQAPQVGADLILQFAATGLAGLWQGVLLLPGTGGPFFLVLLGVALFGCVGRPARPLLVSGIAVVASTYLLLGVSRAGLGVEAATASRYAYFGMLFTLPVFAHGLSLGAERLRNHGAPASNSTLVVITVATVAVLLNGAIHTKTFIDGRSELDPELRAKILASVALSDDGQRFLNQEVSAIYNGPVTVARVADPAVRARLPDDRPSRLDILDTAVVTQVAVRPDSLRLPSATGMAPHNVRGTPVPDGCARLTALTGAWLDLPPTANGSQVLLDNLSLSTSPIAGTTPVLPVQLIGSGGVSDPQLSPLGILDRYYVGSTAKDATLRVTLPRGEFRVCLP